MLKVYANAHGNYIVETPWNNFHDEESEARLKESLKKLSAWNGFSLLDNGDLKWEVTPKNIIAFTTLALQTVGRSW